MSLRLSETRLAVRELQKHNPTNGYWIETLKIARRRIRFETVEQLITDACRLLVPEWRALNVVLAGGGSEPNWLELRFGRTADGDITIRIDLNAEDVPLCATYLFGATERLMVMLTADFPEPDADDDDDGGEELQVPTLGAEVFAELPAPATLH